jgi:hypothetical protein
MLNDNIHPYEVYTVQKQCVPCAGRCWTMLHTAQTCHYVMGIHQLVEKCDACPNTHSDYT